MKKKWIILLIILVILILAIVGVIVSKNNNIEKIASKEFGNDYCEAVLHISTMDIQEHECKICKKTFQASSMNADICLECANKTNRCDFCGKKLTEEIKEQRENILSTN